MSKNLKIISIVMKVIVAFCAILGTILSAIQSSEAFMGGSTVFMYFTIQSNLLIALICIIGIVMLALNKKNDIWNIVKFVGTIAITLTGLVFCFVLAPTMWEYAWGASNVLTHVIVPVCSIIDFFLISSLTNFKRRDVIFVIIPPLLYAIYAGIGFGLNWQFGPGVNYPYFFLNWGSKAGAFGFSSELPFMGCMWWILLLLLLLIGLGFLYLKVVSVIKNKTNQIIAE